MLSSATLEPPRPTLDGIRAKIQRLLSGLDASFLEREVQTRLALLSLLSGHHLLLLGPPGTAKSLLARAVCRCVEGGRYFEYLLSRFTHPDELFGPVSIPGLKDEDYRRITKGYLPDAHIVFLDEVFKANSAILNSLLTLVNERVFHHGLHRDTAPLLALVGASNEPPDEEALAALYDRFLVRVAVRPLAGADAFLRVSLGEVAPFVPAASDRLTLAEVAWLRAERASVQADGAIRQALVRLRSALQAEDIPGSDRRWRWALELVQVAALTSGRRHLEAADLLLLQHCFGTPFETDSQVQRVVCRELLTTVHPLFSVEPLREAEAELHRPLPASAALTETRTRRLALIDQILHRSAQLAQGEDLRRSEFLQEGRDSLWLHEIPPEVFAAMLVAHTTLRDVLAPLQAMALRYQPRLQALQPIRSLFGASALQHQLQHLFAAPTAAAASSAPLLAWVVAVAGDAPQRAGLTGAGRLVPDAPPPAGDPLPEVVIDDDFLFDVHRRRDWQAWARAHLRAQHPQAAPAFERAFLAMLEEHRRTTAEDFPLPEPPEAMP